MSEMFLMNLYYVYKDKYSEEKEGLNIKTKRYFYYKKLRLIDDYQYESEEEEKQQKVTSKKFDKKDEQPDELRFDVIKKKVQNAKKKKKKLLVRIKGSKVININKSSNLLDEIENGQITYEETLKQIENNLQSLNSNQINLLNILFMVNEIFTGESGSVKVNKEGNIEIFKEKSNKEKQESDEKLDTTNMPELESEESAAERITSGKGLKILAPNQMLRRLPITLAQLKARNNSEKLN